MRERTRELVLTLDRRLQRELEVLARDTVRGLATRHVSAAAIVVIDNPSGEILGYVGSPDMEDAARLGQNDGVLALRQPGSALKPFVYELAMERLGFTAATVLPDVELFLPTGDGDYRPNNYDGRTHGPVRLREALADSYNIPAVWTVDALGPSRVLERLLSLGMASLDRDAEHYGAALALGDGEVRLLDLAAAYATLARGGVWKPVRAVKAATGKDGRPLPLPEIPERRVLDEAASAVITDVLADKEARLASFGEGNVLELPFPAAAKTGTSKGFRDNWAMGYTPEVTVGVWVGNFDGAPMEGVSGISGAGPLFHDAMLAASRGRPARAFARPAGRVEEAEVCSLSGARPTGDCPHRRREIFAVNDGKSTAPEASCAMHRRVRVDKRNGLRAGTCPPEVTEERVFERFEAIFAAWARSVGRSMEPTAWSPLCPGSGPASPGGEGRVRVAYPPDGARFSLDPGASARQAIVVRADVPPGVTEVRITVDGHPRPLRAPFALSLPLAPGEHRCASRGGAPARTRWGSAWSDARSSSCIASLAPDISSGSPSPSRPVAPSPSPRASGPRSPRSPRATRPPPRPLPSTSRAPPCATPPPPPRPGTRPRSTGSPTSRASPAPRRRRSRCAWCSTPTGARTAATTATSSTTPRS